MNTNSLVCLCCVWCARVLCVSMCLCLCVVVNVSIECLRCRALYAVMGLAYIFLPGGNQATFLHIEWKDNIIVSVTRQVLIPTTVYVAMMSNPLSCVIFFLVFAFSMALIFALCV